MVRVLTQLPPLLGFSSCARLDGVSVCGRSSSCRQCLGQSSECLIIVRHGKEPRLEGAWRKMHATGQHGLEEATESSRVLTLRLDIIAHRFGDAPEHAEH